jgi:hypothetical protein
MSDYIECHADTRDHLSAEFSAALPRMCRYMCALVCAPPGSGKTRMMRTAATHHFNSNGGRGVVYLLNPNDTLSRQTLDTFIKTDLGSSLTMIDATGKRPLADVTEALEAGKRPVVYTANVGFRIGDFSPVTKNIINIMRYCRAYAIAQIALLDESDRQITHMSGGINATFYQSDTCVKNYASVWKQKGSLNTFDKLREHNVRVMGFSGTHNNMICSKLTSMGYAPYDVCVFNAFPIVSLYAALECISLDTSSLDEIVPYLLKAEASDDHIVMNFSSITNIKKFITDYKATFGHEPAYTRIDSKSVKPEKGELKKYVIGVNMISVGFDFASWMPNKKIGLGVLMRKLSDKGSQPLSRNEEHILHHDYSSSLLQTLLRMRDGGTFLVPDKIGDVDIVRELTRVSEIIRDGVHEFARFGGTPPTLQVERYHRTALVALIQNIRDGKNTPTVEKALSSLNRITGGRDLAAEHMAPDLDIPFWTAAMGVYWGITISEWEELEEAAVEEAKGYARERQQQFADKYLTGGGERVQRECSEEVKAYITARAGGFCMHCGEISFTTQDIHMRRFADGGAYSKDNCGRGCCDCDCSLDTGKLVYSPDGKCAFMAPTLKLRPHAQQLREISAENFAARWAFSKKHLNMAHLSDEMFEVFLCTMMQYNKVSVA